MENTGTVLQSVPFSVVNWTVISVESESEIRLQKKPQQFQKYAGQ